MDVNKVHGMLRLDKNGNVYPAGTDDTEPEKTGFDTHEAKTTRSGILFLAKQCVCKDRNAQYGEPEDVFNEIADHWNIYLHRVLECPLTAADVAVMMILLKVARLHPDIGVDKSDTWVDIAGYAACGGELDDRS